MSRGSWRSAEALHKRQVEQRAVQRADERARLKREREVEEWHITGEPAFQPKERTYPHGGGVKGAGGFLSSAERAIHLYDRYELVLCRFWGVGQHSKTYSSGRKELYDICKYAKYSVSNEGKFYRF